MTVWSPHVIKQYAEKGGLHGEHAVTASVLSWAATKGADHYDEHVGTTGRFDQRGLFALPRHLVTDDEWETLFDPVKCAAVALRIVGDNGNAWDWHPHYWQPAYNNARDFVSSALRYPGTWSRHHVGQDTAASFREAAAMAIQLRDATRS